MPALTTCPICNFTGSHGFTDTVGGIMMFYHGDAFTHRFWVGNQNTYLSLSAAFEAEVAPRNQDTEDKRVWCEAWRAQIAGKKRRAKRLFTKWQNYSR